MEGALPVMLALKVYYDVAWYEALAKRCSNYCASKAVASAIPGLAPRAPRRR